VLFIRSNGKVNQTTGGIGCLLIGLLTALIAFYGAYWFLRFLWWASPVILGLAVLLHWRSVAESGRSLLRSLQTNPLQGIFALLFAVFLFPLFSFYLFLKAVSMRWMERQAVRLQKEMDQVFEAATGQKPVSGRQPGADEFVDFEELETKRKEKE
jgi:hypothetical protein